MDVGLLCVVHFQVEIIILEKPEKSQTTNARKRHRQTGDENKLIFERKFMHSSMTLGIRVARAKVVTDTIIAQNKKCAENWVGKQCLESRHQPKKQCYSINIQEKKNRRAGMWLTHLNRSSIIVFIIDRYSYYCCRSRVHTVIVYFVIYLYMSGRSIRREISKGFIFERILTMYNTRIV